MKELAKTKPDKPVEPNEDDVFEWRRKYRPRTLDQIVGNTEAVELLKEMLNHKRVPHCLLFTGPFGSGKTSAARIMRRAIGCAKIDYREVNAADVTGVDSVREITRAMNLKPAAGPCRVWFLDELHKLSYAAREALLVPTESAPKHVYFFLGTTEPFVLSQGIRSRATEIPFSTLSDEEMTTLINRVARKENVEVSPQWMEVLISAADGCARMGLNLFEKSANLPPEKRITAIKREAEKAVEGIELCRALLGHKGWAAVVDILKNLKGEPESVRRQVLGYANACLLKPNPDIRAFSVIASMRENLYNSGMAGLTGACYEIVQVSRK